MLFIRAPDFSIEQLASSAIGMTASRGTFQAGFYNEEGEEIGFVSPGAVAEFVRRAYLSGSGNEGDDGGGEPPDLPRDGGEDDCHEERHRERG